ncbi:MAG: redoxin domain-containing protein [Chloroflexi bacterium]|nr:redoxin domain-containing protein [Chloroflexota bacterium]
MWLRLAAVSISLATAAGLLFIITRPLGSPPAEGLTLTGEALLKDEAAERGLAERDPAPGLSDRPSGPTLALVDLDGQPADLSEYRGRPVWIVFWATYCHACQLEEPDLRRAFVEYSDKLTIVAIDIGEDRRDVRRYVDERDLPWTVLIDTDGTALNAYGAIGTPTHYFVNGGGTIDSRAFGRLRYDAMARSIEAIID